MLIWRGWGILAALIPFLALVVVQLVVNALLGPGTYTRNSDWFSPIALLVGAAVLWPLGRRLNGGSGRTLVDPQTGQQVVLRRDHSLFFVKIEYWAVILAVVALIMLILGVIR
jgi:hypothetical protein